MSITETTSLTPRDYQNRIADAATGYWGEYKSSIVVSPCGSGKTLTALLIARRFLDEACPRLGINPDEVGFGWITSRPNLLSQAVKANEETRIPGFEGKLIERLFPISMWDGENAIKSGLTGFRVKFLIEDEAHRGACVTGREAMDTIKPDFRLGLSATPIRGDNASLLYQKKIHDAQYRFLIDQGYLAQFNQHLLARFTPESVTDAYIKAPDRWGKSVMFFLNTEQCEDAASRLQQAGFPTRIVSGSMRPKQRDVVIEEFSKAQEGIDCPILISMAILSEGLDVPSMRTVFVRDTITESVALQMSGRVLRKHGDVIKNIVQSHNTHRSFIEHANPVSRFRELESGEWEEVHTDAGKVRELIAKNLKLVTEAKAFQRRMESVRYLDEVMRRRKASILAYNKELQNLTAARERDKPTFTDDSADYV